RHAIVQLSTATSPDATLSAHRRVTPVPAVPARWGRHGDRPAHGPDCRERRIRAGGPDMRPHVRSPGPALTHEPEPPLHVLVSSELGTAGEPASICLMM